HRPAETFGGTRRQRFGGRGFPALRGRVGPYRRGGGNLSGGALQWAGPASPGQEPAGRSLPALAPAGRSARRRRSLAPRLGCRIHSHRADGSAHGHLAQEGAMKTVYTNEHRHHHGQGELIGGKVVPVFEMPRRAEIVIARVRQAKLGPVLKPESFPRKAL